MVALHLRMHDDVLFGVAPVGLEGEGEGLAGLKPQLYSSACRKPADSLQPPAILRALRMQTARLLCENT